MPLARTVARRVGSTRGFDADAAAYVRAVQSADGAALEPAVAFAINNFVIGCKADGVWTAIKASCILMGARTLSGALTPLVGAAPTNNGPFVSGDYNRKTGLIGNGTSKYLKSGRLSNDDPQNNQHLAVWLTAVATSGASAYPVYIGSGSGYESGASHVGRLNNNSSTLYVRCRAVGNNAYDSLTNSGSNTGLVGMSRAASSSYAASAGATSTTFNTSSTAPNAIDINVFNSSSGGATSYSNGRIAFYSIGTSLTLATLSSRVSTLYADIGNAIA